jgi:hypothetical protein
MPQFLFLGGDLDGQMHEVPPDDEGRAPPTVCVEGKLPNLGDFPTVAEAGIRPLVTYYYLVTNAGGEWAYSCRAQDLGHKPKEVT